MIWLKKQVICHHPSFTNNNDTESPEDLPEEQASQLKVKVFAVETCARGAGTHGDVLNVHTGTF